MAPTIKVAKHVYRHGNRHHVLMSVPAKVRPILGKNQLLKVLATSDPRVAKREAARHILTFKMMIAEAEKPRPNHKLIREALAWKDAIAKEDWEVRTGARDPRDALARLVLIDHLETIEHGTFGGELRDDGTVDESKSPPQKGQGRAAADLFHTIALGIATPISLHLETWFAEMVYAPRTAESHRQAIRDFERWMTTNALAATIENVDDQTASKFKAERLVKADLSPATSNKLLSGLRSYFRWLKDHGYAQSNPWLGKSISRKRRGRKEKVKNSVGTFSPEDVAKLLASGDRLMKDVCTVAALSGLRREEIFLLTVADCTEGLLNIRQAKTEAGIRVIPQHSAIQEVIERRCKDKGSSEFVFPEIKWKKANHPRTKPRPRGDSFGKRFATHRGKVLGKEHPGNFHAFRKFAARSMSEALEKGAAGFTAWTVADVLGHDRESLPLGMTFGIYAGPSGLDAKRAAIESIKLPNTSQVHRR